MESAPLFVIVYVVFDYLYFVSLAVITRCAGIFLRRSPPLLAVTQTIKIHKLSDTSASS